MDRTGAGAGAVTGVAPDPLDQIYYVVVSDGKAEGGEVLPLPAEARQRGEARISNRHPPPLTVKERIQPKLWERIQVNGAQKDAVLINFVDDVVFPPYPFPSPPPPPPEQPDEQEPGGPPREAPGVERLYAAQIYDQGSIVPPEGQRWIASIRDRREQDYDLLLRRLARYQIDPQEAERFWLVRALRVSIVLAHVPDLVQNFPEILYVELCKAGEPPPGVTQVPLDDDHIADPQAIVELVHDVGLETLLPMTGGRIALLDTGIAGSSKTQPWIDTVLQRVLDRCDCVIANPAGASAQCTTNAIGDQEPLFHGTYTAAVLTANSNDPDYQGATRLMVDSYTIYETVGGAAQLVVDAALRAFETATASGRYSVIVASMQGERAEHSTIASAADRAFDNAGLVVIAANGNTGGLTTVPANAQKVIGVGALDLLTRVSFAGGSWGTLDGRVKPDVQGPSDYRAFPPPTSTRGLGATSGATPIIGAAAALLRDWLGDLTPPTLDAGHVYAHLILAGQLGLIDPAQRAGVGPVRLVLDGPHWWGKHNINDNETITLTLSVDSPITHIDVAVWWAEAATDSHGLAPHNRIILSLYDPGGQRVGRSLHADSVFQRVRAAASPGRSLASGTWQITLRGYSVPVAPQTVYWAAAARPATSDAKGGKKMAAQSREPQHTADSVPTTTDGSSSAAAAPSDVPDNWYEGASFNPAGMIPPWLRTVGEDGWRTGHVVFLQGYVGNTPDPDYFRLYRDPGLRRYLDIPTTAVVYAITYRSGISPLGLSYLWIKADTPVVVGEAQSTTAHLLDGPISQEYGGSADAWTNPVGRPGGAGGPSMGFGCAPSSTCGSPVCPH